MKIMAMVLSACLLCGCNTLEGLGKDIQAGGAHLEKSAR